MLFNSIKMQISFMIRRKTTVAVFFFLMIFVLVNFFENMKINADTRYITQMYDIVKILLLSDWTGRGYFLMEFFPLLVVIPTAYSYIIDRDTNMKVYIQARVGERNYWYGKLCAVFFITFIVFSVPFLIELCMNGICFSVQSGGDPSNLGYDQIIESDGAIFLAQLFFKNKIIYAVLCIVLFAAVSGILAVFNFSVSTLKIFKYKIYTLFPIYVLFFLISILEKILNPDFTLQYIFILRMFNTVKKNYFVYGVILTALIFLSIILVERKLKKNEIEEK